MAVKLHPARGSYPTDRVGLVVYPVLNSSNIGIGRGDECKRNRFIGTRGDGVIRGGGGLLKDKAITHIYRGDKRVYLTFTVCLGSVIVILSEIGEDAIVRSRDLRIYLGLSNKLYEGSADLRLQVREPGVHFGFSVYRGDIRLSLQQAMDIGFGVKILEIGLSRGRASLGVDIRAR